MLSQQKESVYKAKLDKPIHVPRLMIFQKSGTGKTKAYLFQTDADTSLRDFYWRYARGIETYDSNQFSVTIPDNTPAKDFQMQKKQKYANTNIYETELYATKAVL